MGHYASALARVLWTSAFWLTAAAGGQAALAGDAPLHRLAVLQFEIEDTSGEGTPAHRADMLKAITRFVAEEITAAGLYDVVPQPEVDEASRTAAARTYLRNCNGCELDIARQTGAGRVMIGWIGKTSTLVGALHIQIKDTATGGFVYNRTFDFRGDNETAWRRAVKYMTGTLRKQAGIGGNAPAAGRPRLAVFDFELDDFTAGGPIAGESPAETARLKLVTGRVRQLLGETARYQLVDTSASEAENVKKHWLRNCNGCDADAALALGADLSFVGMFRKISVMEHTLSSEFDAHTPAYRWHTDCEVKPPVLTRGGVARQTSR
jgi:hypothetical protein